MNDNLKKAQAAAHTPEANAKRAATMKKRKAAERRAAKKGAKVTSIPLSAIPDDVPTKKQKGKRAAKPMTNADIVRNLSEAVVLLLRIVNK
ncbi:MAG TPA: hypothetical protein VF077_10325 [Nitrospiraceae bacterium]